MQFVQNVPFFSIMLCMVSGIFSAMLPGRVAKWVTAGLSAAVAALNLWLTLFMWGYGESYVYWMGHFPAPWGNELRAGVLEPTLAVVFSLIMLLSVLGGMRKLTEQVDRKKVNIVCVMLDLVLAAMMSMLYTNDLFTAYVFIEIMTLTACALIMSRQNGRTMVSAMRYMIMSLLGSGLTLIAITITYNLTGHLLMENIHDSLMELSASGEYTTPITVIMGLFFVGLGIKSALYPFHTWLPDAYGYSTPTASAVLGDLISIARRNNRLNSGFVKQVLPQADILPPEEASSTYYMRFMVKDDPGVLRDLSGALSDQGVSIAQAIQKGQSEAGVPLVFMTHEAPVSAIRKAIETMRKSDFLLAPAICYRVMG